MTHSLTCLDLQGFLRFAWPMHAQPMSRPSYVFFGIATILQYLYTPSHLSTVLLEVLLSEDLDCRFLFSLQEDRRICRHSKLLIDAGPGFLRRGQAPPFAKQTPPPPPHPPLNSLSELDVLTSPHA